MDWTNPFIIGPLCMGAGVFLGMVLMRLLDGKKDNAQALAALRNEFDEYRTNVNEHFEQTSQLFEGMTEKYRDVYNHLAAGAQQFGNSEASPPRLEIVQPAAQLAAAAASAEDSDPDAEQADAEAGEDTTAAVADAPDSKPAPTEAGDADTSTGESEGDSTRKSDDTTDAFDPSALDESELADLEEAKAESADDDTSEPEPDTDEKKARVSQNTFRDMPASDEDKPESTATGNGSGKASGKAETESRKDRATQA